MDRFINERFTTGNLSSRISLKGREKEEFRSKNYSSFESTEIKCINFPNLCFPVSPSFVDVSIKYNSGYTVPLPDSLDA